MILSCQGLISPAHLSIIIISITSVMWPNIIQMYLHFQTLRDETVRRKPFNHDYWWISDEAYFRLILFANKVSSSLITPVNGYIYMHTLMAVYFHRFMRRKKHTLYTSTSTDSLTLFI